MLTFTAKDAEKVEIEKEKFFKDIENSIHDAVFLDFFTKRLIMHIVQFAIVNYRFHDIEVIAMCYSGDNKTEIIRKHLKESSIVNIQVVGDSLLIETFDSIYTTYLVYDGKYIDIVKGKKGVFPFA